MLFSMTLSTSVTHLAWEHMNGPAEILVEPEQVTVETVDQELYHVSRTRGCACSSACSRQRTRPAR